MPETPIAEIPTLGDLETVASTCTRCALAEGRTHVVFGDGDPSAGLVFVGEGPGAREDEQGLPFVGPSGNLLTELIEGIGLRRGDCYIANVVKCRPPANRDPLPVEIAACRPYLEAQLGFIEPTVVVTLGNFAMKLLLDTTNGITKMRGSQYPFGDSVLVPTFHPAAALRGGGGVLADMRADFVRVKRLLTGEEP
ncbi:MAG: uracil-DNA glycosylase [Acidimicrobiia bacterium]